MVALQGAAGGGLPEVGEQPGALERAQVQQGPHLVVASPPGGGHEPGGLGPGGAEARQGGVEVGAAGSGAEHEQPGQRGDRVRAPGRAAIGAATPGIPRSGPGPATTEGIPAGRGIRGEQRGDAAFAVQRGRRDGPQHIVDGVDGPRRQVGAQGVGGVGSQADRPLGSTGARARGPAEGVGGAARGPAEGVGSAARGPAGGVGGSARGPAGAHRRRHHQRTARAPTQPATPMEAPAR